ncbi:cyclophilin peptidyl-prolyl cis-trans isomerase Cyp8 [Thecaphora frezii]
MGHGKSDRLYVTPAEHSGIYGQHGASSGKHVKQEGDNFKPLPFDCCAISLQPWANPVCSKHDGTIFELTNVIPFVKKYGVNPATGQPLDLDDLTKLNFAKNERGRYHDPVSYKEFGEHSHIVAVAPSGNVYSYDSLQQLNIKAKFMRDLLTDEPFTKKDIITLQDPHNAEKKDISKLHHVQKNLVVTEADRGIDNSEEVNLAATGSASSILSKLRAQKRQAAEPAAKAPSTKAASFSSGEASTSKAANSTTTAAAASPADTAYARTKGKQPHTATSASTGWTAASFTSTALTPRTRTERVVMSEEEHMFEQFRLRKTKEKAYVRLATNFGPLNLELHCDKAPKTCYNFLQLCKRGKYDDTVFHRNIAGFMIQGGDPTGTGSGGSSIWGSDFGDEYDYPGALGHSARGTLSMANRGPATNSSQFFLTYRATPHLDRKHTVFGRLVDGERDATLEALEQVPTQKGTDRPLRTIRILETIVTQDPFEAYAAQLERKLKRDDPNDEETKRRLDKRRRREQDRTTWLGTELPSKEEGGKPNTAKGAADVAASLMGSGVGKYLASAQAQSKPSAAAAASRNANVIGNGMAEKKKPKGGFGDFSSW